MVANDAKGFATSLSTHAQEDVAINHLITKCHTNGREVAIATKRERVPNRSEDVAQA